MLGFDRSKTSALDIWRENARKWPFIGPPWRPSPGDLAIYRRRVGARLPGRALLLGATPELRDLLAEHAGAMPKPVIVDMSRDMLLAMSALTRRARPDDETWLVCDWCEAALPEQGFDVILADMVWWTVSVETQTALRDRIARLLAPGGVFVSRFRLREPQRSGDDPQAATGRFLARLDAGGEDEQRIRDAWLSYLYDVTTDVAAMRLDRERVRTLISAMRDEAREPARRRFFDAALSCLVGADWTAQTREEVLAPLLKVFVLLDEAHASDYESAFHPILSLGIAGSD